MDFIQLCYGIPSFKFQTQSWLNQLEIYPKDLEKKELKMTKKLCNVATIYSKNGEIPSKKGKLSVEFCHKYKSKNKTIYTLCANLSFSIAEIIHFKGRPFCKIRSIDPNIKETFVFKTFIFGGLDFKYSLIKKIISATTGLILSTECFNCPLFPS